MEGFAYLMLFANNKKSKSAYRIVIPNLAALR